MRPPKTRCDSQKQILILHPKNIFKKEKVSFLGMHICQNNTNLTKIH